MTLGFNCDPGSPLCNFLDEETRRTMQTVAMDHLLFVKEACELRMREGWRYLIDSPLSSQVKALDDVSRYAVRIGSVRYRFERPSKKFDSEASALCDILSHHGLNSCHEVRWRS